MKIRTLAFFLNPDRGVFGSVHQIHGRKVVYVVDEASQNQPTKEGQVWIVDASDKADDKDDFIHVPCDLIQSVPLESVAFKLGEYDGKPQWECLLQLPKASVLLVAPGNSANPQGQKWRCEVSQVIPKHTDEERGFLIVAVKPVELLKEEQSAGRDEEARELMLTLPISPLPTEESGVVGQIGMLTADDERAAEMEAQQLVGEHQVAAPIREASHRTGKGAGTNTAGTKPTRRPRKRKELATAQG